MNRTNLAEMLGEAFSLLERDRRGETLKLPGFNVDQEPDELVIPKNLYFIGTLNEIDQSVETLDFALRRRFLWRECPFERDTLLEIVSNRWEDDIGRFSYDDAAVQLERFADRAEELNSAIEASGELGRQYQVGHTYFADVAFFIGPGSGREEQSGEWDLPVDRRWKPSTAAYRPLGSVAATAARAVPRGLGCACRRDAAPRAHLLRGLMTDERLASADLTGLIDPGAPYR